MSTARLADEELVEQKAQEVVECLKGRYTLVYVGGWSGIGSRRVLDHVAAALDQNKDEFFGGCVRMVDRPYRTISIEYEIRSKIQQLLQVPILGGSRDSTFWNEIGERLKWKPLVVIVDDQQSSLKLEEIETPASVSGHIFKKIVYTGQKIVCADQKIIYTRKPRGVESLYLLKSYSRSFEDDFLKLSDEVALQMVLYEGHSAAMATKKDLPAWLKSFLPKADERMTSTKLHSLAPIATSPVNIDNIKGEDVIQFLFCHRLLPIEGCPLALQLICMRHENIPLPYVDDYDENSCNTFLLLHFLLKELVRRCLVQPQSSGYFCTTRPLEYKLASLTSSSSSSSSSSLAIMSQFQGDLVRHSKDLERVDMGEWTQDLTRISFANNKIQEILLPPPSIPAFPNLSTLFLHSNPNLQDLPDDVFRFMPYLRVLDLSHCNIKTHPSSLSCLQILRMLSLEHCKHLQTVEMTGLDNLQVLMLRGCPLDSLRKASWCHMRSLKLIWFDKGGLKSLEELQLSLRSVKVFDRFHELDLRPERLAASQIQKCNIVILYPDDEDDMQRRRTRDAHFQTKSHYRQILDRVGRLPSVAYPTVEGAEFRYNKTVKIYGGEGLWSLYTITGIFQPHFLISIITKMLKQGYVTSSVVMTWSTSSTLARTVECFNI